MKEMEFHVRISHSELGNERLIILHSESSEEASCDFLFIEICRDFDLNGRINSSLATDQRMNVQQWKSTLPCSLRNPEFDHTSKRVLR